MDFRGLVRTEQNPRTRDEIDIGSLRCTPSIDILQHY